MGLQRTVGKFERLEGKAREAFKLLQQYQPKSEI